MGLDFKLLCQRIGFDSAIKTVSLVEISNPQPSIFAVVFEVEKDTNCKNFLLFLHKLSTFVKENFGQKLQTTLNFEDPFDEFLFFGEIFWQILNKISLDNFLNFVESGSQEEFYEKRHLQFLVKTIEHLKVLKSLLPTISDYFLHLGFSDIKIVLIEQPQEPIPNPDPENLIVEEGHEYEENNFFTPTKVNLQKFYKTSSEHVAVEGQIFNIDRRVRGINSELITIQITDFGEAISLILVRKEGFVLNVEVGDFIYASGNISDNHYRGARVLYPRRLQKIANPWESIEDLEPKPRIEFWSRTIMSTMDGIAKAQDYVNFALQLNHPAIGISDINSVQSFPDLAAAAKGKKIQPIYGTTLSVYRQRDHLALLNSQHIDLSQQIRNTTFVVLDLETTGLSPIYNDIIEFGGVKLINGEIVERIQFFIKPNEPLPQHISKLTGITEEDLEEAYDQKTGIEKIAEFCQDHVLVAHNANFDFSFLQQKFSNFSLPPLQNLVIDTLWVSRFLTPNTKRHSLERVALRLGVEYDPTTSHRADYDTNVLAKIWQKFLQDFEKLGIFSFENLYNLCSNWTKKRPFLKESSLIARNNAGLKELYKIITNVHTQNFNGECQLDLDSLEISSNILLGSGATHSLLYDLLFRSTDASWREEIKRYDYIEIVPPRSFSHLISREDLTIEQVEDGLKNLILEAKKLGKIFVATAEPCYIFEYEKIVHEVYINAKGLGGAKHKLFSYDDDNDCDYPLLNFLTTQEMRDEFEFLEDEDLIEELVVTNCYKLLELIEPIEVFKKGYFVPKVEDSPLLLESNLNVALTKKYGEHPHPIVVERINKELKPILDNGYDGIYWISHLLVKKSLEEGFVVGSRGSVGSSLIAYLLGITEVNPLPPHYLCSECGFTNFDVGEKISSGWDLPLSQCPECKIDLDKDGHNIPFETFLGFKRDKTPDIDLNFSGLNQGKIHEEVKRMFGESHTFRAGTISTNAQKTAYGYVKNFTEEKGLHYSASFIDFLVQKAAGVKRTTGQHPGGIIVVPQDYEIEDFTPVNFPANDPSSGWKTTHFDFGSLEHNLLKFDILGHDDPTVIKILEELTGCSVNNIPKSDPKVLSLFSSVDALGISEKRICGETTGALGLPEFGSRLTRQVLKQVKITSFSDLISISGLTHGTNVWKGNAEILIRDRAFRLHEVITCRDDIMLHLIKKNLEAQDAFDIMEEVRRGRGLSSVHETLLEEKRVEHWYINSLKKISYLFPKAHATAYVIMAWRIAWFKLYHPLAFYAAYFEIRAESNDYESLIEGEVAVRNKISDLRKKNRSTKLKATPKEKSLIPVLEVALEMLSRGIKVAPISLEDSLAKKWKIDKENNLIIPPLICIDGLGVNTANAIIRARDSGPFSSISNFSQRTGVNKTILNKLKKYNVFEGWEEDERYSLF